MLAGRLTEQITLLKPLVVIDRYGAEATTWEESPIIRAEVQWKGGETTEQNGELFETRRVDVLIRWREVDASWRVKHDGILYNISAIEPNRRKQFKRLICKKVNE